jgi:hypothetical protein
VDEVNEEKTAATGASTARHGAASIAGDERGRRVRVSSLGRNRAERGKIGGFRAIYTFTGVCWRSRIPAATADVALGVAVASSWASGAGDKDDDHVFGIILANRYVGSCWAHLLGCWLARGLRGWAVLLGCAMSCSAR